MSSSTRPLVLITGGTRGIGAATALALAERGHDLALSYRDRSEEAEAIVEACRERGAQARAWGVDLSDPWLAPGLLERAVEHFGRVDHLVNNAGITGRIGEFAEVDLEQTERMMRLNVLTPIALSQAFAAHLRARGARGSIVNVSSGAATTGSPHTYVPYAMSKAALNALTIGLSKELGPEGIRVNTVSPGTTHTEIHADAGRPDAPAERSPGIPLRRAGEPEEIAAAICFLISEHSAWTTGADLRVAGGA